MAKFLPFIVEKSTPINIFQTIISRSKGINNLLIASLFNAVIDMGIKKVREAAKELPDIDTGSLYEELMNKFSAHKISNKEFKKIQAIGEYVTKFHSDKFPEDLIEFESTDIMIFLLIMYKNGKLSDYTILPIENLFNGTAEEAENSIDGFKLFSNTAPTREFSSIEDLIGYVNFYTCISPDEVDPVKAVIYKEPAKAEDSSNATS